MARSAAQKDRVVFAYVRLLFLLPGFLSVSDLFGVTPASSLGSGGSNQVVIVVPGNQTLGTAIAANNATGVTLQLQAGTYTEDLSLYPATISDLTIQGPSPPGGSSFQTPAQIQGHSSMIVMTNGPASNDATIWTRCAFLNLVITGSPVAGTGFFRSTSSSFIDLINNTVFDLKCPLVRGMGSNFYSTRNSLIQSSSGVSGQIGQCILGVGTGGSFWSVDDTFDFTSSLHLYIGTAGSGAATAQPGPCYIVRARFNPSQYFTQDVAVDAEHGSQVGASEYYLIDCTAVDMKLAYNTNVGLMRLIHCRQTITPHYGNDMGQSIVGSPNGDGLGAPSGVMLVSMLSSGTIETTGELEVDNCTVHQEADSNPVAQKNIAVFSNGAKYLQRVFIHGGRYILNPASGPPSGSAPGVFRTLFPSNANAQPLDHMEIDDVEVGYNTATLVPATPTNLIAVGSASAGAATVGRARVNGLRVMGSTGQPTTSVAVGASPFTYLHGTTGATPAAQPGVVRISGGTVSGVVYKRPNFTGGFTYATSTTNDVVLHLEIGDTLVITYTVAPTLTYIQVPPVGGFDPTTAGDGVHPLLSNFTVWGTAAKTVTVASEETFGIDGSSLAAAGFSGAIRAILGTYTATVRRSGRHAPLQANDTYAAVGSGVNITHGTTAMVTAAIPCHGAADVSFNGGAAVTQIKKNGVVVFSQASGAIANPVTFRVAVGDTISVTFATTFPPCTVIPANE